MLDDNNDVNDNDVVVVNDDYDGDEEMEYIKV